MKLNINFIQTCFPVSYNANMHIQVHSSRYVWAEWYLRRFGFNVLEQNFDIDAFLLSPARTFCGHHKLHTYTRRVFIHSRPYMDCNPAISYFSNNALFRKMGVLCYRKWVNKKESASSISASTVMLTSWNGKCSIRMHDVMYGILYVLMHRCQ